MTRINLTVDGAQVSDDVEPRMLLVQYLRERPTVPRSPPSRAWRATGSCIRSRRHSASATDCSAASALPG
jgi:hypothetical protein